jgi:hypothetical protein
LAGYRGKIGTTDEVATGLPEGVTTMSFFVGRLIPFVAATALQLTTVALLPGTKGFTAPLQTLECLGVFFLSLWMIARIAYDGASLGILIPRHSLFSRFDSFHAWRNRDEAQRS